MSNTSVDHGNTCFSKQIQPRRKKVQESLWHQFIHKLPQIGYHSINLVITWIQPKFSSYLIVKHKKERRHWQRERECRSSATLLRMHLYSLQTVGLEVKGAPFEERLLMVCVLFAVSYSLKIGRSKKNMMSTIFTINKS